MSDLESSNQESVAGSLAGRSAIVTGSGRGIGAATAVELARRGAKIVLNYLSNAEAADTVRERIVAAGGTATAVQADAGTEEGAAALADAALGAYDGIDILVSNAGPLFRPIPLTEMTWDDFGGLLNDDMKSAFFATKSVLPTMIERGRGRIVYIGSASSQHASPGLSHHGSSRAALATFARYVAKEMGPHGITSNVVAPGMVKTDRTAGAGDMTERVGAITPVGRIAAPEDVAKAVAFFAEDAEGFYTGAYFPVEGGLGVN